MSKFICDVCDFIYDENIEAVKFKDLPEDYICPVCGASKDHFKIVVLSNGISDVVRLFSNGIYFISTKIGEIKNVQTANSVLQMTASPRKFGVSLNKNNYTTELILKSKKLAVHIGGFNNFEYITKFGYVSGRDVNKFDGIEYEIIEGLPIIKNTLGYIIGDVIETIDLETHFLFIVKSDYGILEKSDDQPMTYREFGEVKRNGGKKKSEVSVKKSNIEKSKGKSKGKQYICEICGYIHDDEVEGIAFEDLPDNYLCPVCGADKSHFKLI